MRELRGKVGVVTGAASGIGFAMAERFATEGMSVMLADVEEEALASAADRLAEAGADVASSVVDVADAEAVDRLRDETLSRFGVVHLVCNNAGVGGGGQLWEIPLEVWRWVMNVNFWGVVHGMRSFVPLLAEQHEGHVVNTASAAGLVSTPFMAPYAASKHAVVAITETLKMELAGYDVGVSVLCPMWVRTRIHESERNAPSEVLAVGGGSGGGVGGGGSGQTREGGVFSDVVGGLIAAGLDPAVVAGDVVHAVREDKFWIVPHEEAAVGAKVRGQRIAEGRAPEFDPSLLRASRNDAN